MPSLKTIHPINQYNPNKRDQGIKNDSKDPRPTTSDNITPYLSFSDHPYKSNSPATKRSIGQRSSATEASSSQNTNNSFLPENTSEKKTHSVRTSAAANNPQVELPLYRLTRESASELRLLANELANKVETSKVILYQDGEERFGIRGDQRERRYEGLVKVFKKLEQIPSLKDEKLFSLAAALTLEHFKVGRCDDFCYLTKRHWLEMPSEFKKKHMKLSTFMYEMRIDGERCTKKKGTITPASETTYNHFFQLIKTNSRSGASSTSQPDIYPDATALKPVFPEEKNTHKNPELVKPVTLHLSSKDLFLSPPGFTGSVLYDPSGDEKVKPAFYIKNTESNDFHNWVNKVTKKMGYYNQLNQSNMVSLKFMHLGTIDPLPLSEEAAFNTRRLTEQLIICYLLKDFSDPMECHSTLMDCRRLYLLPPSVHYGPEWDNTWENTWNIKTLRRLIIHQIKNRTDNQANTGWKSMLENSTKKRQPEYLQQIVGTVFKSGGANIEHNINNRGNLFHLSCLSPIAKRRDFTHLIKSQNKKSGDKIKRLRATKTPISDCLKVPAKITKEKSGKLCKLIIKKHDKVEHVVDRQRYSVAYRFCQNYIFPNLELIEHAQKQKKKKLETEFCSQFSVNDNELKKLQKLKDSKQKATHNEITKDRLLREKTSELLELSINNGLSNKKIKETLFRDLDFINQEHIKRRINSVIGLFRSVKETKDESKINDITKTFEITRKQFFEYSKGYIRKKFLKKLRFVIAIALKPEIKSTDDLRKELVAIDCKIEQHRILSYLQKFVKKQNVRDLINYCKVDAHTAKQWLGQKHKIISLIDTDKKTKKNSPNFKKDIIYFALNHTHALLGLASRPTNEDISNYFDKKILEEAVRRLCEIRRWANSEKETDKESLIKVGFSENEIKTLEKKLSQLMVSKARHAFVEVISLLESGKCQSFDEAIEIIQNPSENISKASLTFQKNQFIKSIIEKPAADFIKGFNINLKIAQRWKKTQWKKLYCNENQKPKKLLGKKRKHTDESASVFQQHSKTRRLHSPDNLFISSSQAHETLKDQPRLSRSDLLNSLYGGDNPNPHKQAALKKNCTVSSKGAQYWDRTFKLEVKNGATIASQSRKYKVKQTTIKNWRTNLKKTLLNSEPDLKLASFILDKLYGQESKNKTPERTTVYQIASKKFPTSTEHGRLKVVTDWDKNKAVYDRDTATLADQYKESEEKVRIWLENYYRSGHPFLAHTLYKSVILVDAISYLFKTHYTTIKQQRRVSLRQMSKDYPQTYNPYTLKISPQFFIAQNKKFTRSVNAGDSPETIAKSFKQAPEEIKRSIEVLKKMGAQPE